MVEFLVNAAAGVGVLFCILLAVAIVRVIVWLVDV